MTQIGIGIIGLGGVGSWGHLPGYLEIPDEVRIVALCDTNPKVTEPLLEKYGIKKSYSNYKDLVADPDVDAVDICLPHFLHAKVALEAVRSKKHVLIEKPFATTLEQADEIISEAVENKVKLMVAENTRFVNAYNVAKKLIDSGLIGEICFARTYIGGSEIPRLSDSSQWVNKLAEAGGGMLFDAGVHSFFLLKWMVGDITSISAVSTKFLVKSVSEVEDNVSGTLKFGTGAIGNFSLSETTNSPWTEKLELFGTEGCVLVDMTSERPVQMYSAKRVFDPAVGWDLGEDMFRSERSYESSSWEAPFFGHSASGWKPASMRKEVQHYVQCITKDERPLVSGEDGKYCVKVALQGYESIRSRKEVAID